MKIYEEKEVLTTKKTLVKLECDVCKKDITDPQNGYYYKVTTSHNDWGNDSCESYEYRDICSDECLQEDFKSYLKSDDQTKCINIERTNSRFSYIK